MLDSRQAFQLCERMITPIDMRLALLMRPSAAGVSPQPLRHQQRICLVGLLRCARLFIHVGWADSSRFFQHPPLISIRPSTMTQTSISLDFSGSDIASRRASAVTAFIHTARRLLPDPQRATAEQLQVVADALVQLGLQKELFPAAHFSVDAEHPAQVYRLAEDLDGHYALYVSAGLPGKAQPPHNHTTWAIIAGISGNERNEVYSRHTTSDSGIDRLQHTRTVDVATGSAITLGPDDVHTIELLGSEPGLHLHFYGLALDRLLERVVFQGKTGGSYRTFAPPALIRHPLISPQALKAALAPEHQGRGGEEIAVLDVRETGVFTHRHILLAASAPLWRLELLIDRLVPRRNTRIVLVDADESLAHQAAAKLVRLGWYNVSVLEGGTDAWAEAGFEIFSGSNVPSKAFGEVIEHEKHTPWIDTEAARSRAVATVAAPGSGNGVVRPWAKERPASSQAMVPSFNEATWFGMPASISVCAPTMLRVRPAQFTTTKVFGSGAISPIR